MSDPTHTMDIEEADPKSSSTILVGVVGSVLLVVLVILLEALYFRTAQVEHERKIIAEQPQQLRALQAKQRELLGGYRIVDAGQQTVAIPIERAMELVVAEAQGNNGRVPAPGGTDPQGN
jgi:hypothetical protein